MMAKRPRSQSNSKKPNFYLNKKQLKRREFINSIRSLVTKARNGDDSAIGILLKESENSEEYRQIVKRLIDFQSKPKQKGSFAKVDYKKEMSNAQHWPVRG